MFCYVFFQNQALADLNVSPIILAFEEDGQRRKDIQIENTGARTQYLEIQAEQIIEPGEFPETYRTSPIPEQVGLLVAPRRVVLRPGEQKLIRVIRLGKEIETDHAWRVNITPVIGEVETSTRVAIAMVGVKALVFARPEAAFTEIVGGRDGNRLLLTNLGTTNALLHSGEQCLTEQACRRIPGKRLWPGMTWETTLPYDAPARFFIEDDRAERQLEF